MHAVHWQLCAHLLHRDHWVETVEHGEGLSAMGAGRQLTEMRLDGCLGDVWAEDRVLGL